MDDDLLFILAGLNPKSRPAMVENLRDLCLGFCPKWKQLLEQGKELDAVSTACAHVLAQEDDKLFARGKNAALVLVQLVDLFPHPKQQQVVGRLYVELGKAGRVDKELFPKDRLSSDVACEALLHLLDQADFPSPAPSPSNHQHIVAYCANSQSNPKLKVRCMEKLSIGNPELSSLLVQACSPALLAAFHQDLNGEGGDGVRALINITNLLPNAAALAEGVIPPAQTKLAALFASDRTHWEFDQILLLLTLLANLAELPENRASALLRPELVCEWFLLSLPLRTARDLVDGSANDTITFSWTPEELVLSSHVCLVLGCLVRDAPTLGAFIDRLPGAKKRGFLPQIQVLQAFLDFQHQAQVMTQDVQDSVGKVASYFYTANQRLMLPPAPPMRARPATS